MSDDSKSFGESVQNGEIQNIQLGTDFKWKQLLEGMKPNGSRLIILPSEQLGTQLGNYPSSKNFAIKFQLVRKIGPILEERVKNEQNIPQNEEKVHEIEKQVPKTSKYAEEVVINVDKVESKSRLEKLVARVGQPVMLMPSRDQNLNKKEDQIAVSENSVKATGTNSNIHMCLNSGLTISIIARCDSAVGHWYPQLVVKSTIINFNNW